MEKQIEKIPLEGSFIWGLVPSNGPLMTEHWTKSEGENSIMRSYADGIVQIVSEGIVWL